MIHSSNDVLGKTKCVVYNEEDGYATFSFVSSDGVTLFRAELDEQGIRTLGGRHKLEKFIRDIESGRRKVSVSKKTLERLTAALVFSGLFAKTE